MKFSCPLCLVRKSGFAHPAVKRFAIAKTLGLLAGLLCVYLGSRQGLNSFDFQNPTFWLVVYNRMLIGLFVAMAGVFVRHPLFGFRCYPLVRGAVIGAIVAAMGGIIAFINFPETAWQSFAYFTGVGAVIGAVIDVIATKASGEGKELIR